MNHKLQTINFCRGMSFVEVLIYTAILALLFVLVVNTTVTMAKSYTTLRLSKQINLATVTALERIARETQNARSVDQGQSVFGANPGTLFLNTTDSAGAPKTIQFFVEGGALRVKENGVDTGPMTGAKVAVDNLTFWRIGNSASEAVRVLLTLSTAVGESGRTATFYDTIVLRGSYDQ